MCDFKIQNINDFRYFNHIEPDGIKFLAYMKHKYEKYFLPGNDLKKHESIRKMQEEVRSLDYNKLIKLKGALIASSQAKETIMFKNRLLKMLDMHILRKQIDSIFIAHQ